MITCLECNESFLNSKKLSDHIKRAHELSSLDYVVKHHHNGKRPQCLHCGGETRFVSLIDGFKRYCVADRKLAEAAAGREGGKAKTTWNKGKNKATDERIARLSAKQSGEGNPFFGKKHSEDTIQRISITKRLGSDDLKERIAARSTQFRLVSSIDDYVSRQQQYLTFECTTCKTHQPKTLQAFERGSRCYKCHPSPHEAS